MGTCLVVGLVLRLRARLDTRSRTERLAGGKLVRGAVEELERLLEHAPRLVTPRAGEGLGKRLFGGLAGGVASRRARQCIVLAAPDGAQEGLAGHPRALGEDRAPRQVQQLKRLVHVQTDARGGRCGTLHGLPSSEGLCVPAPSPPVRRVLIGGIGDDAPQPPVQTSHVIGNPVAARAQSQGVGRSELLVTGDPP